MSRQKLFSFKSDISSIKIADRLNNPFSTLIPHIAKIAAEEFQTFIGAESEKWNYDFSVHKGKMFGVLVVKEEDGSYAYLGSVSGKLPAGAYCNNLTPSVFNVSTGDYFINKGMTGLSELLAEIKLSVDPVEINLLREKSRTRSIALQKRLFENYHFTNLSGVKKNLLEIFEASLGGNPPTAAGECAAPKLLQYAIEHQLKPIAIAEFWWGKSMTRNKVDKAFYPACKDRCKPILEFMLEDVKLFERRLVSLNTI